MLRRGVVDFAELGLLTTAGVFCAVEPVPAPVDFAGVLVLAPPGVAPLAAAAHRGTVGRGRSERILECSRWRGRRGPASFALSRRAARAGSLASVAAAGAAVSAVGAPSGAPFRNSSGKASATSTPRAANASTRRLRTSSIRL